MVVIPHCMLCRVTSIRGMAMRAATLTMRQICSHDVSATWKHEVWLPFVDGIDIFTYCDVERSEYTMQWWPCLPAHAMHRIAT